MDIFLHYCTCCLTMYHSQMVCLDLGKNPLIFDTINAMAVKGLHHFTILDFP